MSTGTDYCVVCLRSFSDECPCCCDSGTYEDGTHEEGRCKECCGPHPVFNFRNYERMDCDH